jgi:hypothetical protein
LITILNIDKWLDSIRAAQLEGTAAVAASEHRSGVPLNRFSSLSRASVWSAAVALAGMGCGCGGQDGTTLLAPGAGMPGAGAQGVTEDSVVTEVLPATPAAGPAIESAHVRTVPAPDGSFTSEVDATDMASWVYFSLRDNAEVTPDVPEQSPLWDLGFQRSNVKVNGGASGSGSVTVSVASGSFEDVTSPPGEGYIADAEDADGDGTPEYAFGAGDGWYSYDPASHRLTARETVFVIETEGRHFKLQFSSYYDAAGTPGVPQFRWAPL